MELHKKSFVIFSGLSGEWVIKSMRRLLVMTVKIMASALIVGCGFWFMYLELRVHPCTWCSKVKIPKRLEPSLDRFLKVDEAFMKSLKNTDHASGLSSFTLHVTGSITSVLDSLDKVWSAPDFDPLKSIHCDYVEHLGPPLIERGTDKGVGYIGYTKVFLAIRDTGKTSTNIPSVSIFNRTALATQESDSTVIISFCETPEPITWNSFVKKFPFLDTLGTATQILSPFPGSRLVFKFGSPDNGEGVWASWIPCSAHAALEYYRTILKSAGWRTVEMLGQRTILFRRGRDHTETLALSYIGAAKDSTSLIVMSFQGVKHPFSSTP